MITDRKKWAPRIPPLEPVALLTHPPSSCGRPQRQWWILEPWKLWWIALKSLILQSRQLGKNRWKRWAFDNPIADLGWGNWGLLLWKPSSFFWFTWGAGKYGYDLKKEAVKKYCLGRKRKREVNSPRRAYAIAQSSVNLLGVRFWQETGSFSEHISWTNLCFWYDICFERVWLTDHDDVMRWWSSESRGKKNSFCRVIRELPFFRTLFSNCLFVGHSQTRGLWCIWANCKQSSWIHPSPGSCSMGLGLHCQVPFCFKTWKNLKCHVDTVNLHWIKPNSW